VYLSHDVYIYIYIYSFIVEILGETFENLNEFVESFLP